MATTSDTNVEANETLFVTLSGATSPSGTVNIAGSPAKGTILNDDTGGTCNGTAVLQGGTLLVYGTDGNDEVEVEAEDANTIEVEIETGGQEREFTFNRNQVTRILVYLCGGDDVGELEGRLKVPAVMHGGSGNDHMVGGPNSVVLLGDEGDDMLVGGPGDSVLIGGVGADRIVGAAGDDLLIGGTTLFDNNDNALLAILAEWTRADRTRIALPI